MKIPWKAKFALSKMNVSTYHTLSGVIANPFTYYAGLLLNGPKDFFPFQLKLKSGHRIPLKNFMSTYIFTELFVDKCYDEAIIAFQSDRPKILEVGGNTGMFTLRTKQLYPGAEIISFEPEPSNYAKFKSLIASNDLADVRLNKAAVGTHDGHIKLHLNPKNLGGHSIVESFEGEAITVPLCCMNDLVMEEGPFDLLKLDCEGAEDTLIMGLNQQVAQRIKKIVYETAVSSERQVLLQKKLQGFGYTITASKGLYIATRTD